MSKKNKEKEYTYNEYVETFLPKQAGVGINEIVVGTCSICRGPVVVPAIFWSVIQPTPQCKNCGAYAAADYGPVIPMRKIVRRTWTSGTSMDEMPQTAEYIDIVDPNRKSWW